MSDLAYGGGRSSPGEAGAVGFSQVDLRVCKLT